MRLFSRNMKTKEMSKIPIKIFNIILEILYIPLKLLPTRRKITFISRQSNKESVDIAMLKKAIKNNISGCEVVTLMKTLDTGVLNKILYGFHMIKQMYHIATSQIVILDTYCMVVSLLHHKKSLIVIQMWHALGLMKKAGYSILDKPEGRSSSLATAMKLHKNYDVIFASSDKCRKAMGQVFGYPISNVYTFPLPRVDLLRNIDFIKKTRNTIVKKYPILKEKKTIVYAPTYRKDEKFMERQVERLTHQFPFEEYNLICNFHPLSQMKISDKRVIVDKTFTTIELLTVADFVISDYSSIIYEAAIMEKPIIFFAFDLDEYMTDREFFIDYESEVPGPVCRNVQELMCAVRYYQYDKDQIRSFAEKYVSLSSKDCTDDITRFLKKLLYME